MGVLRWVGIVVAVVLGLVAAAVGYVGFVLPSLPAPYAAPIQVTPERLARGTYLAEHVAVCMDCHSERDFSHFAGPIVPGTLGKGGERFGHELGFPGDLFASNITPAALGTWTDGELLQALTAGVTPDHRALFPFMNYPAFAKLCRADLEAIVSYVRNLSPIENVPPKTTLDFPVNLIVRTLPEHRPIVETCPDPKDTLAYGGYLVSTAGCIDCHTQREGPDMKMELAYAGGFDFPLPGGVLVRSKNITPDETTGIGSWSREAFINRFAAYRDPTSLHPTGRGEANTIMPWSMYAGMTDSDLGAIYDFLRTVKPVKLASGKVASR